MNASRALSIMTEIEQMGDESHDQRATKRRKADARETMTSRRAKGVSSNGNSTTSLASSSVTQTPGASDPSLLPEQKRALWLAALTRQELEGVAAGIEWNPGNPHNPECFVCKRAGGLIGCRRCPRSYHSECIGIRVDSSAAVENWDCPACALLSLDGAEDILPTRATTTVQEHSPTQSIEKFRPINPQITKLVSGTTSVKRPESIQSPKPAKSTDAKPLLSDQEKSKRRSRYSTLPNEVDEALAIINRELEAASYSKSIIAHTEARLHVAEQDLAIERGKSALAASVAVQDEIQFLKEQVKQKDLMIEKLHDDNIKWKAEAEKNEARVKELEDWKRRMKMMIDGTSDN